MSGGVKCLSDVLDSKTSGRPIILKSPGDVLTDLSDQLFFGQDRTHRSFVIDKITVVFIHVTPNKSTPGIHRLVASVCRKTSYLGRTRSRCRDAKRVLHYH